jgi:glycine/D-amino acid oxidase-like deaminating enzyme
MSQFVVIGGGIAGLTAANALANTGAKVTIFEQARELGGRARTRQEGDYFLNLGPHALYAGGVAARTFAEWNVDFSNRRVQSMNWLLLLKIVPGHCSAPSCSHRRCGVMPSSTTSYLLRYGTHFGRRS